MSEYYLCTPGEVMNAALPGGLKLTSETLICLKPEAVIDPAALNEREQMVVEALTHQKKLSISMIAHIAELQKVIPLVKNLIEKGIAEVEEKLQQGYRPKKQTYVRFSRLYAEDEEAIRKLFDDLGKRAFRQLQLIISYINLSRNLLDKKAEVSRQQLLKSVDGSPEALKALVEKGIFEIYEKEASHFDIAGALAHPDDILLSEHQQSAHDAITEHFKEKDVVLLHGITSSGKTEIYIKLIAEALENGKQVLYLLPEIALTSQIINRLRKYFGDQVGIYHSRYNENERAEIWYQTLNGKGNDESKRFRVMLGARSALFLPYSDLGLVIVDEEHDSSYKQYDPAPRYNARDSAIYLAGIHGAKTVLGSATPAVESYYNTLSGKYGLVEMSERFGGIQMPEILIANMKEESRRKTLRSIFSSVLMEEMNRALENKEQIILFQNRRGFSLHLECDVCNWIPQCKHCDISLTYHKAEHKAKCHYCGYSIPIPPKCPECGNTRIVMKGFGTEKIEEELELIYPEHHIRRMDLDSTRTKNSHHKIISEFEERKIDILVGTQMVTKGLDFDNVSVVGILNADNMIHFPDFRSYERSFQLMAQVSGRAGRKSKRGRVVIQTYNPNHPVIRQVINNDYDGMFRRQVADRLKFHYPPYYRLIILKLKHKDYDLLNHAAAALAKDLRTYFGKRVLGPEYPLVSRIKDHYIKDILVKIERNAKLVSVKEKLAARLIEFQKIRDYQSVRVITDVDPL